MAIEQIGPPPINEILAEMSDRMFKGIGDKYAPAFDKLQTDLEYEVQRVNEQFNIKQQDMYRLFISETDPKRKKAVESRMLTAKNAAQARIADIRGKQQPAIDELNATRQQEVQIMQRKIQEKNIALQTIRQLVQAGDMSPIQAKKAEYKMVGINWEPPKQATLEQTKTAIEDDLRDVTKILKDYDYKPATGKFRHLVPGGKSYGTSTLIDPTTGKKRKATEEEAKQLNLLKEKKGQLTADYQNLLMQSDPRFRTIIERDQRNRAASKTLTGGARPNLETAIRSTVGKTKQKLDAATARAILQEAGGDKEKARQLARSRGYKL